MDIIEDLIQLLNEYLRTQLQPKSFLDIFIQYISPILQLSVVIGGAIAGLYKYFKTRNQETYQRLLSEVYAPLYQYFVKQELIRDLVEIEKDYKKKPIIEFSSTKTITDPITNKSQSETKFYLNLNRQELIKVLDSINIGLASKELYTLLTMYQVLVHLEESEDTDAQTKQTVEKRILNVESRLRREIILGYEKYHKKLGIKGNIENDFLILKDDKFIYNEIK